jgi:hypothetical protein
LLHHSFYAKKGVVPNSYSFSLVFENKVLKYISRLGVNKSTGLDGIPSRFIKDGAPIIASPLAHIINLSLIQGTVPDDMKSARVVPLFKKDDKTAVGNYRPVSILCIISKILKELSMTKLSHISKVINCSLNSNQVLDVGFPPTLV